MRYWIYAISIKVLIKLFSLDLEHEETILLKSDIDLAVYCENSISEFIEDIEMNTSTLLEFDFSDMKDIQDEFFIEQVEKEGIIIYEKH